MQLNVRKSVLLGFFISVNVYAVEINTHQAITRCATQEAELNECNKIGAKNLHSFAENSLLVNADYSGESFENYGKNYFSYAQTGEGLDAWHIAFSNASYQGLIEAGVILEDGRKDSNEFLTSILKPVGNAVVRLRLRL